MCGIMFFVTSLPYFDHLAIKLVFAENQEIDKLFVSSLLEKIVEVLNLKVVQEVDHDFPGGGLTRVLVLSQSHLICHTWPENNFIHLDLMTCSEGLRFDSLRPIIELFSPKSILIQELKY
ncbi:MAG: S-adenosylmethionine decarboxylase [Candidatus Blackburnbacteria bacterium]|nr:S-adenosylmethionine decarboxylase [Candidatus Blackburnbacteria bacterium]